MGRPVLRGAKSSSHIPTFNVKRSGPRNEVKVTEAKPSQSRTQASGDAKLPLVLGTAESNTQDDLQWPVDNVAEPAGVDSVAEPAAPGLQLEELLDDVEDVFHEVRRHGMVSNNNTAVIRSS